MGCFSGYSPVQCSEGELFFFEKTLPNEQLEKQMSLKKEIAQLKQEKDIKRTRMSEVCADLVYHCKRHANEDYLLSCAKGSPHKPSGIDPYKEGASCEIM
ncbi:hypothetical protein ACROYT_G006911 [Oculina patagonica]